MAKGLRALVLERLTAAAEDILLLFERTLADTLAEYERELHREETRRRPRIPGLQQQPRPEERQPSPGVHVSSLSPGPDLDLDFPESPQIKEEPEEQILKQEEDLLPVCFPEASAACVKREESSLRQTELETQGDFSSEPPGGHTEHSSDTDWGPFSCSVSQVEAELEAESEDLVQSMDIAASTSAPPASSASILDLRLFTDAPDEDMSGAESDSGKKKYQCPFCKKRFVTKMVLENHVRVHTGEKPFSCSTCNKAFSQKSTLDYHLRIHSGARPHACSTCGKTFVQNSQLRSHLKTHTGEKPFSCSFCGKAFAGKRSLRPHEDKCHRLYVL